MLIVGLSCFYHDSAAVLLDNGNIVAAAQEERFTRKKHDSGFPRNALEYCIRESGASWRDIALVAFYEKPHRKAQRIFDTYLNNAPKGYSQFSESLPIWFRKQFTLKSLIANELAIFCPSIDWKSRLIFSEHHLSHAASAFFPSPFASAAVLTLDGVGEFTTTSLSIGRGNSLDIKKEIYFPDSLGLLYSAFTDYLGFRVNSGEYKVMGLAPYGYPEYGDLITRELIHVKEDGSFRLNQKYFAYCTSFRMINERFCSLFGHPRREPESPLTSFHFNMASSIQAVLNDVLVKMTRYIAKETQMTNLCLAGGVALNCVSNSKISNDGRFRHLWIQPAAGDAGGALGAALVAHYHHHGAPRTEFDQDADSFHGGYLGPSFPQLQIENDLIALGADFEVLTDGALLDQCANDLAQQRAVGWFQGRMEFGPRALGNRSILADPRSPTMQSKLNLKIKYRESFRPFAPSVLSEDMSIYFKLPCASPYMLFVGDITEQQKLARSTPDGGLPHQREALRYVRSRIPAVTHVDNSARVQTVDHATNPRFHALLSKFKQLTGCSVLLNTSFNVRGEPIVCTPEDAFRCFMSTEIEVLAIGNCLLRKENQPAHLRGRHDFSFDPD